MLTIGAVRGLRVVNAIMRWRAYPALRVALALIVGIVLGFRLPQSPPLFIPAFCTIWLMALLLHRAKKIERSGITGVLIIALVVLLGLAVAASAKKHTPAEDSPSSQFVQGLGVVMETTPPVAGKCRVVHKLAYRNPQLGDTLRLTQAFFTTDSLCDLTPGDTLAIAGYIRAISLKGIHEEGYASYLLNSRIFHQIYPKKVSVLQAATQVPFHIKMSYSLRRKWAGQFLHSIGGKAGDFLASLCLGYRVVDHSLKRAFQSSGAMHILAISGLHVGIAAGSIRWLLSKCFKKTASGGLILRIISQVCLWAFVLISGSSDPAVRAGIMLTVWDWGKYIHRKTHWSQLLSISALIQIAIDPFSISKVGFQFSYAAVAMILLLSPWIQLATRWTTPTLRWLTGLVLVSLAAQMGVAGLGLYYFRQFPPYFLITNLVALPAATFFLVAGWCFLPFSFHPGWISNMMGSLLKTSADLFLFCIESIAGKTPSDFANMSFGHRELGLYYAGITAMVVWLYSKRAWLLIAGALLIAGTILSYKHATLNIRNHGSVTIWENKSGLHALVQSPNGIAIAGENATTLIPYDVKKQLEFHNDSIKWDHIPTFDNLQVDIPGRPALHIISNTVGNLPVKTGGDLVFAGSGLRNTSNTPDWLCQSRKVIISAKDSTLLQQYLAECRNKPEIQLVPEILHHCFTLKQL